MGNKWVWAFNADLYCGGCADKIVATVGTLPVGKDYTDSDNYPQGPYMHGGGESDTPTHCGHCGMFMENDLTTDGIEYVREALETHDIPEWSEFYAGVLA